MCVVCVLCLRTYLHITKHSQQSRIFSSRYYTTYNNNKCEIIFRNPASGKRNKIRYNIIWNDIKFAHKTCIICTYRKLVRKIIKKNIHFFFFSFLCNFLTNYNNKQEKKVKNQHRTFLYKTKKKVEESIARCPTICVHFAVGKYRCTGYWFSSV